MNEAPSSTEGTLYHCNSTILAPGSIIEPGNWGRMLRLNAVNDQTLVAALREAAFEYARQIFKPSAPSRLHCNFALPSLAAAQNYRDKNARMSLIYEAAPINIDHQIHTADYERDFAGWNGVLLDEAFNRAERYWTMGPSSPATTEILISSPLRIVRQIP